MPKIDKLYAWIISDKNENDEGVPAFKIGDQVMPLMGADLERAVSFEQIAQNLANGTGKTIRLVRSTGLEVVKELKPEKK